MTRLSRWIAYFYRFFLLGLSASWLDWLIRVVVILAALLTVRARIYVTASSWISIFDMLLLTLAVVALLVLCSQLMPKSLPVRRWFLRRAALSLIKAVRKDGELTELVRVFRQREEAHEAFWRRYKDWEFLKTVLSEPDDLLLPYEFMVRYVNLEKPAKEIGPDFQGVLEKLERTTRPWTDGNRPAHDELCYVQTVSGALGAHYARKVLRNPFLHRLNQIRQLGTLSLSLNIDAAHRQLAHACGTAECAALFLGALRQEFYSRVPATDKIGANEEAAVLVGALCHDIFSTPFGHSLDLLKSALLPDNTRDRFRLHDLVLQQAIEELNPGEPLSGLSRRPRILLSVIEDALPDGGATVDGVINSLKFIFNPERQVGKEDLYFLVEILDSPVIDADRLDFVVRDALHLGQPMAAKTLWIDILTHARVVEESVKPRNDETTDEVEASVSPQGDETTDEVETSSVSPQGDETTNRVAFSMRHRKEIGRFLNARRSLYQRVYESPDKLCFDDMLCHCIYYHLELAHIVDDHTKSVPECDSAEKRTARRLVLEQRRRILDEFMMLTDEDLFPFLAYLREAFCQDDDVCRFLADMVADIQTGKAFFPVCRYRLTEEQWMEGILVREEVRVPLEDPGGFRKLGSHHQIEYIWLNYANTFYHRVQLEQEVWQTLLSNEKVSDRWMAMLTQRYREESAKFYEVSKKFPGVHLTIPRFQTVPGESPRKHPKGLQYDPRSGEPFVLYYDDDGKTTFLPARGVRPRRRYRLIASVPFGLHTLEKIGGDKGLIHKVMVDEVQRLLFAEAAKRPVPFQADQEEKSVGFR